jgi:hypothetical protein
MDESNHMTVQNYAPYLHHIIKSRNKLILSLSSYEVESREICKYVNYSCSLQSLVYLTQEGEIVE